MAASYVLEAAIEGLVVGGIYALLGLGFFLMFGVLKRLNLAYGTTLMVSVYLAALAINEQGLSPFLTLPLALILGLAISAAVERLAFTWVRGDGRFSMVSTLGIWMVLDEILIRTPGRGRGQAVANPFDLVMVPLGVVDLRLDYLIAFAASLLLCFVTYTVLYRSDAGVKIRVVVEDRALAALLGLDAKRIARWSFAFAAVIGVLSGYIFSSVQTAVDVHFGMWATLKGLVILVLGGVGSFWGVVAAALGLGVLERVGTELAGPGYRDLIGYGLMVALLALFPRGLGGYLARQLTKA
jgi:branched-subunit amino acid ABC-type transport system permease component